MRYTVIGFSQTAFQDHFPELHVNHIHLLNFIVYFSAVETKHRMVEGDSVWAWISFELVQQEMPILKIGTKRTYRNYLKILEQCGLIERHPENKTLQKTYLKIGKNYKKVTRRD